MKTTNGRKCITSKELQKIRFNPLNDWTLKKEENERQNHEVASRHKNVIIVIILIDWTLNESIKSRHRHKQKIQTQINSVFESL